ncbi:sulfotransferase domain-containing protein [Thiocystis violacea]|uniref:sulfotransferase domain-containing protein n=1 Tax=Thiocystis violacea TaxID=13725 RepID=UPI00190609A3|nr:sulfotransferase domain-containing protein [Thiocystis violacea]MBK1719138.1 hypothetical protein [Thiocystis violacea]
MTQNFFIGIGAQKCASTWLHDILLDHPGVVLGQRKEIDFFSYHYGRGHQWYERQFPELRQGVLAGEISPSYFVTQDVPARLRAYNPSVKILLSLRDPVERAISNHRHEVRLGNFSGPDLGFEAGLDNNPMYFEQSRYGTHLLRWRSHFPASRILVVLQEDIEANPVSVAQQVYSFLDLDPGHLSAALHARSNESHLHRSRGLESVRLGLRGTARSLGMDAVWRAAQRAGLQPLYRRLNRRASTLAIPRVSEATRQHLRERLEGEIRLVEELLERPLPTWRTGTRAEAGATLMGGHDDRIAPRASLRAPGSGSERSGSLLVSEIGGSQ